MEKRFFSFQEAAEFLMCSRSFLDRLVASDEIPSYKIGMGRKGRRLFDKEELIEWVKSHKDAGEKPPTPRRPSRRPAL